MRKNGIQTIEQLRQALREEDTVVLVAHEPTQLMELAYVSRIEALCSEFCTPMVSMRPQQTPKMAHELGITHTPTLMVFHLGRIMVTRKGYLNINAITQLLLNGHVYR